MSEVRNPEARKPHEAEPALTDLAVKIIAIIGGGFGLELSDRWQQIAVWIVAALLLVGSSAWMRQKVTPVWKAVDWIIDAENTGWLAAANTTADTDEEPEDDPSDDPAP